MLCKYVLGLSLSAGAARAYHTRFFAESGSLQKSIYAEPLGSWYDLSESQRPYAATATSANSWWSTSFVYGSDDREYLLVSHILTTPFISVYRASSLDLSDNQSFRQYSKLFNASAAIGSDYRLELADYFMGSTTDNDLGPTNTWTTDVAVQFNITYELSSPVILNGGVGSFWWQTSNASEWSMPAGRTHGSFVNTRNETIQIIPEQSLTWYDRQFQDAGAGNWTWFQLHLNSGPGVTGEKHSIWFYPNLNGGQYGFSTRRTVPGSNEVVAATLIERDRTWTSPLSNWIYRLEWRVDLADGTTLNITLPGPENQELCDDQGTFCTYEGYIEISGTDKKGGRITGFGLVEVQPLMSSP
ncbi:Kievitone hydratase-like protein [Elsinoe fawcettii]|nr:Kievitone hydratase-like protein [Elsinoe fawcettii]